MGYTLLRTWNYVNAHARIRVGSYDKQCIQYLIRDIHTRSKVNMIQKILVIAVSLCTYKQVSQFTCGTKMCWFIFKAVKIPIIVNSWKILKKIRITGFLLPRRYIRTYIHAMRLYRLGILRSRLFVLFMLFQLSSLLKPLRQSKTRFLMYKLEEYVIRSID